VRRRIGVALQDAALDGLMTGRELMELQATLHGMPVADVAPRSRELLERVGLSEARDRRVATYSGGMRRRLDLAAGLVGRPEIIFLDEPTTGLDPRSRQAMWDVVTELVGTGVTVFLTTQYLEEADRLADRIAVIDGGRVVAEGTAAELKRRVVDQRLEVVMADAEAFTAAERMLGDRTLRRDPAGLTLAVATDGSAGHVRALLDALDPDRRSIARFAVHGATLDDVFLTLTGRSAETTHDAQEVCHV
jgi:ABC-2 type transport system ATP-binding protein